MLAHCPRLTQEVAPPTPKGKRGRPWRYGHDLYLYRKTKALLHDLMEPPFPSHPSLARYAVQHLDSQLLEALLERLSQELEARLPEESPPSPP